MGIILRHYFCIYLSIGLCLCSFLYTADAYISSSSAIKFQTLKKIASTNNLISSKATSIQSENDLLALIAKTDRGEAVSKDDRLLIREWFNKTSLAYNESNQSPFDDEITYGNFDVTYVDSGKSQDGNPAGGRLFRGSLGRLLYRNEGLFQHLIREPSSSDGNAKIFAINYIKGKLFNFIPMAVILKGVIARLSDEERMKYVNKYNNPLSILGTGRADFEPPIIAFGNPDKGNAFSIQAGPGSFVILDTTYVSPRIRLGLGSRGSIFVFSRTNNPLADTWKQYLALKPQKASELGVKLIITGTLSYFLSSQIMLKFAVSPLLSLIRKIVMIASMFTMFTGALLSISRGGIERNDFAKDVNKGQ